MVLQSPTILRAADENLIYLPSATKTPLQSSSFGGNSPFGQMIDGQSLKKIEEEELKKMKLQPPFWSNDVDGQSLVAGTGDNLPIQFSFSSAKLFIFCLHIQCY